MRVLPDECVPRALRKELLGHEVKTVAEVGRAGVKNGELLQLAARQFDLLLTVHAPSNDVALLRPLMPAVLAAIPEVKSGMVTHIRG